MPEDGDHARSQAGHHVLGIRMPIAFCVAYGVNQNMWFSPMTDDPIVMILWVMAISGVLMLGCIAVWLVGKLRHKREEDEQK